MLPSPEPGEGHHHHPPWNGHDVHLHVPPDMPIITFWEAVNYSWRNLWGGYGQQAADQVDQTLPGPLQIWWALHVHPRVTLARSFWFLLGSVSFLFSLVTFSETQYYISTIGARGPVARVSFFCMIVLTHTIALVCLLFFGFFNAACERYRHHFLIKSVGDFLVMFGVCLLLLKLKIRQDQIIPANAMAPYDHDHHRRIRFSEVAGVVTSALITVDALSIINLLRPGHHYFIFEVTTTLTMHVSLELLILNKCPYLGAFAALFIFLITVVKNFIWRNIVVNGQAAASMNHDVP